MYKAVILLCIVLTVKAIEMFLREAVDFFPACYSTFQISFPYIRRWDVGVQSRFIFGAGKNITTDHLRERDFG